MNDLEEYAVKQEMEQEEQEMEQEMEQEEQVPSMVPSFSQDTEESIEEESMEIAKQSMNLLDSNDHDKKETSGYECFNICRIC